MGCEKIESEVPEEDPRRVPSGRFAEPVSVPCGDSTPASCPGTCAPQHISLRGGTGRRYFRSGDLRWFGRYGPVGDVHVPLDFYTRHSRGFCICSI